MFRPLLLLLATVALAAGAELWWSERPLVRPDLPAGRESHPVDCFIRAKQRELGLQAVEEADRRTLVRRLAYDLWGMPLPPERVEAFVKCRDEQAYEKLVDELLASPRYGERWARHWLDAVHFGETHGYDKDKPRPHAWPYRDYVIRAFNQDKPYEEFVQEQIAGDVLRPYSQDGLEATGFLAAGPWDFIGHVEVPESKIDGQVARNLDRDDIVTTVLNTFCSLTVQCARCHDHKADPVTMEDYYSLQAVFAALDRADRAYGPDPATARRREKRQEEMETHRKHLHDIETRIEAAKTSEIKELEARIARAEGNRAEAYGYHSEVAPSQDTLKWVQVDLGKMVPLDEVRLFPADEYGFADFGFPHRFRIEVSGNVDFSEKTLLAGHHSDDFPRPGAGPVVIAGQGREARYVRVVATHLWNRRRVGQAPGSDWIFALGELTVSSNGKAIPAREVQALDSIEAPPRWGRANLIDGKTGTGIVPPDPDDIARRDRLLQDVVGEFLREKERLQSEIKACEEALAALPKPRRAYVGTVHHGSGNFIGRGHLDGTPRKIHVLDRGEVTRPLEPVGPAPVPGVVAGMDSFDLPDDHREGDRRVALAQWITHPHNTLTWRSIVNRVWQHHFGSGLVETANDFGRLGAKPTHPELLDWLAVEFRDNGGSFKKLHRLIVTSETYRQKSASTPANASRDTSNRFLWRQNRRRLEAEAIRDTILLVAGKMNLEMGGPSFQDFVIEKPQHSPHYRYDLADPDDPSTHRRAIYRFLVRSQPQPFMDALDCADPSLLVAKRSETTTSLQALAMMNNRFLLRMAEHAASDLAGESDPVATLVTRALGRPVRAEERLLLKDYQREHGLPALVRLVFNLSEFSYAD